MFSLQDKRILVTGASSGIGSEISKQLAAQGARVTIVGRDLKRLAEVKSKMEGSGHDDFAFDLAKYAEIIDFVKQQASPFDGIVFNAGIVDYVPVKFISPEKINTVFDTNFGGNALLCQQLIKNKLIQKAGSLVFISSISAKLGIPGTALYAASKAAISAYAKVVASELAGQKIRSNSISPGIIVTPMTANATDASTTDLQEAEKQYPLGYGEPADVSALVVYLLSNESRWMTGTDLILDGGFTLK
ncbi:SDR family oxidoreductase [Pedobacter frigiditerrae]|uniref:SDR family NAD(P)-dependent oxidoreductase n=1 Tax=Pedobacter frigiditerrae TaxID=2530452 RepID=UPI00292D4EB3|nr:SDR family oxidoreductase [Pedobacter frigiditerrae]